MVEGEVLKDSVYVGGVWVNLVVRIYEFDLKGVWVLNMRILIVMIDN